MEMMLVKVRGVILDTYTYILVTSSQEAETIGLWHLYYDPNKKWCARHMLRVTIHLKTQNKPVVNIH